MRTVANIKNIIENYNVKKISFVNGDIKSNKLNAVPIFIINLKHDKIRRSYIINLFNEYKINFNLIIVDKLKDVVTNNQSIEKLGCTVSHLWCLNNAIKLKYDKFIIFEDDIIFHKMYKKMFEFNFNFDYDLLMLGASDFNFSQNCKNFDYEKNVYFPNHLVCGAFANLYSLNFASELYNFKLNNLKSIDLELNNLESINIDFDSDTDIFYKKYKIAVCHPNIVIADVTQSNLNHKYSLFENNFYISQCFDNKFSYLNYNYITSDFLNFLLEFKVILTESNYILIIDKYVDKYDICAVQKSKIKKIFISNYNNVNFINKILNNIEECNSQCL